MRKLRRTISLIALLAGAACAAPMDPTLDVGSLQGGEEETTQADAGQDQGQNEQRPDRLCTDTMETLFCQNERPDSLSLAGRQ